MIKLSKGISTKTNTKSVLGPFLRVMAEATGFYKAVYKPFYDGNFHLPWLYAHLKVSLIFGGNT